MQDGGVHTVEIVFLLLLLFVAAFGALASRLLNPDVIFFVVLPPLLYSAAWRISWREFSYNLVSISSLAIGLVTFTVLGVAEVAQCVTCHIKCRFLPHNLSH